MMQVYRFHPYTLRNEEQFLTLDAEGNPQTPEEEFKQLIDVGVDGFFTDFPATGVSVVDSVTGEFVQSPQNPDLGDRLPNLASSKGFEGMAFSPDRKNSVSAFRRNGGWRSCQCSTHL